MAKAATVAAPTFLPSILLCTAAAAMTTMTMLVNPASAADLTKFKVYFHDVVAGANPTAVRVAQAPSSNSSSTFFGAVVAIDDPLTSGPESGSEKLGRAQETYMFADQKTFGLLMNMNFVFTGGDHNGSSLAIFGRNEVLSQVREMSIFGGTGKFRMARGYVEACTVDSGATSGETVVELSDPDFIIQNPL